MSNVKSFKDGKIVELSTSEVKQNTSQVRQTNFKLSPSILALRQSIGITSVEYILTDEDYKNLMIFNRGSSGFLQACKNVFCKHPDNKVFEKISEEVDQEFKVVDLEDHEYRCHEIGAPLNAEFPILIKHYRNGNWLADCGIRRAWIKGLKWPFSFDDLQAAWNNGTGRQCEMRLPQ